MAKVILICGKICCGKSTYARQLSIHNSAAILSIDEILLALFGQHLGEKHDEYGEKTRKYLFDKSVEFVESGVNVILDWGFWSKANREDAKAFYKTRNIEFELHYIDISEATWRERLNKRNKAVLSNRTNAYYVDDNLVSKFHARFDMPDREEIDVWVKQ